MASTRASATRPPIVVALVVALVFVLLGGLATPADAHRSREQHRLEQTRAKIAKVRTEIEQARRERAGAEAALADAERQLATVLEAVAAAELAVQRQEQAVIGARRELEALEEAEAHQRRVMGNRAATLYRQGSAVPFAAVLAAESPADAVKRSSYVEVLSRADLGGFQQIEISQVAVDAQRDVLEAEEEILRGVLAEQEAIHAEAQALRDERALVAAGSREKLADLQSEERHLESESRQVAAMARRAAEEAARANQGRVAAASASGWAWPARGRVTSGFGRRWGRMHEGIDIGAGHGAAVGAARAGRVSFAGRMGGYGNMVLVDHGAGIVTAYAHLSAFQTSSGQQVAAGQRIGSVGCTGSCTGPHLHFEVRVNGAPRNPRNYLP